MTDLLDKLAAPFPPDVVSWGYRRPQSRPFTREQATAAFLAKVSPEPNSGCWLWTGAVQGGGYGSFSFEGKIQKAHRVSHQIFKGQIPDGLDVMHSCDVRCCVNPTHICAATTLENIADMWRKWRGNPAKGERNSHAKLTAFGVTYIREMHFLVGKTTKEIADKFQISTSQVRRVIRGDGWRA